MLQRGEGDSGVKVRYIYNKARESAVWGGDIKLPSGLEKSKMKLAQPKFAISLLKVQNCSILVEKKGLRNTGQQTYAPDKQFTESSSRFNTTEKIS